MRLLLIIAMMSGTVVLLFLTVWFWDLEFLWPCAPLLFIAMMAMEDASTKSPDRP